MGHSSLVGTDRAPALPAGTDTEALGPSDTSDSGSDVAGIGPLDDSDPGLPVDVAVGEDRHRASTDTVSARHSDTDANGTGERRSAAGDAGRADGSDIGPDRIIGADDDADGVDDVMAAEAGDPLEDEPPDPDR